MITDTTADQALDPVRREAQKRRAARAASTYGEFINDLQAKGFGSKLEAEQAAVAVLCALEQRLTDDTTTKLESQLPLRLTELLFLCERHEDLLPRNIRQKEFFNLVSDHFSSANISTAEAVRLVFEVLAQRVSAGEIQKVIHLLPRDLRELWPEWARTAEDSPARSRGKVEQ
jgi:uncharacterized protein (DUF2267 family)